MKRFVPLWITAIGGFVLIVAYFVPVTQGWGEVAAIWFDILAAIAFVLGGGNLLKVHLRKVSDKKAGWGYSVVTVLAFFVMLYVGLVKWGAPPAPDQEFYGQTFAHLPVESIPESLIFRIDGAIPQRPDGGRIHAFVRAQIGEENGQVSFRGWMQGGQQTQLLRHYDHLEWQCLVEQLYKLSQPSGVLKRGGGNLVAYYADHEALSFVGHMTQEHHDALLAYGGDENWQNAVNALLENTQATTSIQVGTLPPFFDPATPALDMSYDTTAQELTVTGPLTPAQSGGLEDSFLRARPMDEAARQRLLSDLRSRGAVHPRHVAKFNTLADGLWTVEQVYGLLNAAGKAQEVDRSACEMRKDQLAGVADIKLKKIIDTDIILNEEQKALIDQYSGDTTMSVGALINSLESAGDFKGPQVVALSAFMSAVPTIGEFRRNICFELLKARDANDTLIGLDEQQIDFLLADYRDQAAWERTIGDLVINAHTVKYSWSGEYRAQGTPYWWLYEYGFKPLQATIFAMLAFYVASAAFRAFRAKNTEAILLLGTAFIILLGRTFAGVVLTAWMPDWLSGLKIENMTVYIMQVFNTAGNRGIMIGIALGITSTSLKVLLGVDRSYLGSGEE